MLLPTRRMGHSNASEDTEEFGGHGVHGGRSKHDPFDALSHTRHIEVQDQPDSKLGHLQIADDLRCEQRNKSIDALHFNDNGSLDN